MSLSNTQQLCALGALLTILQKHDLLNGGCGEDIETTNGGPTPLMSVEKLSGAHFSVIKTSYLCQ